MGHFVGGKTYDFEVGGEEASAFLVSVRRAGDVLLGLGWGLRGRRGRGTGWSVSGR